jgi:hypothetical protein
MPLDKKCYEYFIKRDCLGGKIKTSIPKDTKGDFPLCAERLISHRVEAVLEKSTQKEGTSEALSPQ